MSSDGRVHFGVVRVDLHLPEAGSLKGKRALLNRVKARVRKDLEVSVAEVGEQDIWQRAVLGIAVAASSQTGVQRITDRLVGVIERDPRVVVLGTATDIDTLDADGPDPSELLGR